MKTDQVEPVREADRGVDVKPQVPRPNTALRPQRQHRTRRRLVIGALALLVIVAIVVVFALTTTNTDVSQPARETPQLQDQSIRGREGPVGAPDSQQGSLSDRSIRGRERTVIVPRSDSVLDQSVRARER